MYCAIVTCNCYLPLGLILSLPDISLNLCFSSNMCDAVKHVPRILFSYLYSYYTIFLDSHLKSENLIPTTSTCPDCLSVREQNMFLEADDFTPMN